MLDANQILNHAKDRMQHAIDHLEAELAKIRAGRANPSMLEGLHVDYYGTNTPVSQVANITVPDAKTLMIQPWEKNMIAPIEKAILAANLGFTPQNDGQVIRINIPALTEERRKDLVKKTKAEAEHCKVSIRTNRKDANDHIKKDSKGMPEDVVKDIEDKIQKMTDHYISIVDKHLETKEKEIMTI
ncbi:MAG: ribosome recycling factor [Bacteroidetes bacterium]|nr:MAG: ribosome recycling factor [Bacteroidota bacterium]REK03391.1 MAG: ribosome recycling factor [Bacteroidota bacterium]REK34497.1 MAG: ribosome recycling factor [Bacteroidota bacterium]REK50385.1 MAG: ribosome recycling factor [Bacteroidota bacterium]